MKPRLVGPAVGILFAAIYGLTMLPGVGWDDTPELALAVECHGIPHSPGFALFVLLARVAKVAGGISGARAATMVAAGSGAAAAALMAGHLAARWGTALGLAGGICLGASPLVWSQATHGEVYTLNLLLITVVLRLSMRPPTARSALGSGYVWGLALGNHPSAAAFAPLLVPFVRRHGRPALLGVMAALSLLMVLPLRSQQRPCLDWGETRSLGGFLWLVSLREFRVDALAGRLMAGGSLAGTMSTGLAFLKSAASPVVLGLGLAALPAVTPGRPLVVLSGLLLTVLTAMTGGGPDVLGYLLPLCPVIILIASEGASLLPFRRPVAASFFLAGAILMVFPEGPPLDRSRDRSAEAYQRAMAAQLDGRGLFTDSSTDLFLMLHHAHMRGAEPRVIYTPYLGHGWYRHTLDPRIARLLPAEPDPPYPLIVWAARAAGLEPVFTFSDLPTGARGVLVPDGWVMRGGTYDPGSDSSAVVQWPEALAGVGQGGRHRALRTAQGGQLLAAQTHDASAASRLAGALKTDPTNRAVWHSLVALYARMNRCEHLVTSAAAYLRCAPWSAGDVEALARSMDALRSPCPAATSLAERLAAAHPRRMPLAAHAARRALADGAPRSALRILARFEQSNSAELMNLRGVALMLVRDYEHAAESLRRAFARSDRANRAPIGANLALCLRQLGRNAEADSVVASLRPEPAAGEP